MKKYVATFERVNPQIGNYEMRREIEAKTIASARKQAREISESVRYGALRLMSVELESEEV